MSRAEGSIARVAVGSRSGGGGGRGGVLGRRSVSPPPSTKVALLQGRLLSKAHSDLQSPTAVQRALMGNVLKSTTTTKSATPTPTSVNTRFNKGIGLIRSKGSSPGPPPPSLSSTSMSSSSSSQVKVEFTRTSPTSVKVKEIISATTTTTSSKSSSTKKNSSKNSKNGGTSKATTPPRGGGSSSANTAHPLKPPRKGNKGDKGSGGKGSSKRAMASSSSGVPVTTCSTTTTAPVISLSPPLPSAPSTSRSTSPMPAISPPTSMTTTMATTTTPSQKSKKKDEPRYIVTPKPLAPPAESRPHHRSLPSLTPYLGVTRRVTDSLFFLPSSSPTSPRPTKTSLMRHIIARDPSASTTIVGGGVCDQLQPRQKRRRSVSCLNLRDYGQYVLALRHTQPISPRFTRLHSLYSSLERLCELEASSAALPPLLPIAKKHDFDAWWKVRHRARMETEIDVLSRELYQAQREREFFFRPKTPPIWSPDSHLRFKKWRVHELKAFLMASGHLNGKKHSSHALPYLHSPTSASLWSLDLYKTGWRGVSVKETALNLEVSELLDNEKEERRRLGQKSPDYSHTHVGHSAPLRRAFSMSSTLSMEQREGIKRRIGTLITAARQSGGVGGDKESWMGGRAAVTTRMGFTLSSDPRRVIVPSPQCSPDAGLSENKKKEISHRISQELKERHCKDLGVFRSSLPISTKMALRKSESFNNASSGVIKTGRPIYSVYITNGVNERIKTFEQVASPTTTTAGAVTTTANANGQEDDVEHKRSKRVVHIVTPQQLPTPTLPAFTTGGNMRMKSYENDGPASLPLPLPPALFRSNSPRLRSPSPPHHRSLSPSAAPLSREYVSHINIISKLAALLLRRNTQLKHLVTREVIERERLERLRALNCGEVERLRDYFEDYGSWEELRCLPEDVNLLRVLFCSDSNLAKLAQTVGVKDVGVKTPPKSRSRPRPDGSSPTPRGNNKELQHLNIRCRKPIYQPSSSPNVCQPTLTAHCYLGAGESLERLNDHTHLHYSHQYPPISHSNAMIRADSSLPTLATSTTSQAFVPRQVSYTNYDASLHQPRFRYVPPPPIILPKRSASSMSGRRIVGRSESFGYGGGVIVGGDAASVRRATIKSLHPAETAV